jgi:hypothetical protein
MITAIRHLHDMKGIIFQFNDDKRVKSKLLTNMENRKNGMDWEK